MQALTSALVKVRQGHSPGDGEYSNTRDMSPSAPAAAPPVSTTPGLLTPAQIAEFQKQGFLVLRGAVAAETCQTLLEITKSDLAGEVGPVEFEAEVHYPGAPASLADEGGRTVRRLKQAYTRHPAFGEMICRPDFAGCLQQLFDQRVFLPLAHHNCVMTKQPRFSSDTLWHQDIRYWAFTRSDLISSWLALGSERPENGCLWVIPGTHTQTFAPHQFDEALFFRTDLPENQALIEQKVPVELDPGDLLFFHCRTFHAASKNFTRQPKFSVVFTFRPADNPPRPGSRSAQAAEVLLPDYSHLTAEPGPTS